MVSQIGQMVEINGTLIPAVNIQPESGFFTHCDGIVIWYDIYFEIMFENGALWIIDGFEESKGIVVTEYFRWGMGETEKPDQLRLIFSWDEFVKEYKEYLDQIGIERNFV